MRTFLPVAGLIACCLALAATPGAAQTRADLVGTWELEPDGPGDRMHLELSVRDRHHVMGTEIDLEAFTGLDRQLVADGGDVTFELRRAAGVVRFEGRFRGERGEGSFRFSPDRTFEDGLGALGFDDLDREEMLVLAVEEVDLNFAKDLVDMDLGRLDTDDLIAAAIFDVTPAFAAEMRALGLRDPSLDDLVQMRVFDIDADLVAEYERLGFRMDDVEDLVQVRVHDLNPDFVAAMRDLGFDPSLDDLVQLKIFDVDARFVREMAELGYDDLSVDDLVQLRIFGIDRAYIEAMREAGLEEKKVRGGRGGRH